MLSTNTPQAREISDDSEGNLQKRHEVLQASVPRECISISFESNLMIFECENAEEPRVLDEDRESQQLLMCKHQIIICASEPPLVSWQLAPPCVDGGVRYSSLITLILL